MTILVFLTAVDSYTQVLTGGEIFASMHICVWFIPVHRQNLKLLAKKITEF